MSCAVFSGSRQYGKMEIISHICIANSFQIEGKQYFKELSLIPIKDDNHNFHTSIQLPKFENISLKDQETINYCQNVYHKIPFKTYTFDLNISTVQEILKSMIDREKFKRPTTTPCTVGVKGDRHLAEMLNACGIKVLDLNTFGCMKVEMSNFKLVCPFHRDVHHEKCSLYKGIMYKKWVKQHQ